MVPPMSNSSRFQAVVVGVCVGVFAAACGSSSPDTTKPTPAKLDAATFVKQQTALLKPLRKAANLGWWNASILGTKQAFADSRAATNALNLYLADPKRFAAVKALRASKVEDPLLRRQIEVLYLMMLGKQVDPALLKRVTKLESEVEQAFNTYRGVLNGKKVNQSEIEKVLAASKDSKQLQAAWEAQKGVGALVASKVIALAKLRNQVAKSLGFRDFYALRLAEAEIKETQLVTLFDELDRLTRKPFLAAKADVDGRLAKRLGVKVAELMPWHYQNPFFQAPPDVFETGMEALYAKQDPVAISKKFFAGVGLEVDAILKRSDLYEKKGKSPHAFATNIDGQGDVRILCNIVPNLHWAKTTVHELGHAVYEQYVDPKLPWLLQGATHAITTEGLAMMLDRPVGDPRWAQSLGLIDAAAATSSAAEAKAYLAFAPLQFSRWTQVMMRFEKQLYANPDQDLNALWWTLVEKYQGLKRPPGRNAPDYASKIHIVVAPAYYHSYMMGDLFAAQVHEAIAAHLGKPAADVTYVGEAKVGTFLKERLFSAGSRYSWSELTKRITGKPLSAEAFARRFN